MPTGMGTEQEFVKGPGQEIDPVQDRFAPPFSSSSAHRT